MIRKLAALLVMLPLATPVFAQDKLSGGEWRLTTLGAETLAADAGLTLSFDPEAHVSGHSGCNRFMGGVTQDGNALSFSALAGTMMACPEPQMEQERRMLELLAQTKSFSITRGGALELLGDDGLILRATR